MKRLFFLLFSLFVFFTSYPQVVEFQTIKSNIGNLNNNAGIYVWSSWNTENISIIFDLPNNKIVVNNKVSYEIIERPTKWHVKRDCKYCIFYCVDQWFNKVCVKLYDMDNTTKFYIYINEPNKSVKYIANYIE